VLKPEILAFAEQMIGKAENEVIGLRRMFHQNPELSFQEKQTSEKIYGMLKEIPSLAVSRPTKTSVLAVLKGGKKGKVLALRSDIDALAIREENENEYKSQNPGVMHACGHDGHMAMLIGAVKILTKLQADLPGEIRFIFQHAEEQPPGGAREIIAQGVLAGVDMFLALHLLSTLPVGKIGITAGPLMASPDNFTVAILGKGGHAAMPQETIDPVLIGAQVITGLQAVVSRLNNPLEPLVLSVTGIHSGSAFNVIPSLAELKGTVRTFSPEKRKSLPDIMEKLVAGTCSAFGARYSFNYEWGYNPVINDSDLANGVFDILARTAGPGSLEKVAPVMWGEDFSAYLDYAPGIMLMIGAGNPLKGIIHPHHHPCFDIDEGALAVGLRVLVCTSLGLLDMI
jgi:amidohydrolase